MDEVSKITNPNFFASGSEFYNRLSACNHQLITNAKSLLNEEIDPITKYGKFLIEEEYDAIKIIEADVIIYGIESDILLIINKEFYANLNLELNEFRSKYDFEQDDLQVQERNKYGSELLRELLKSWKDLIKSTTKRQPTVRRSFDMLWKNKDLLLSLDRELITKGIISNEKSWNKDGPLAVHCCRFLLDNTPYLFHPKSDSSSKINEHEFILAFDTYYNVRQTPENYRSANAKKLNDDFLFIKSLQDF